MASDFRGYSYLKAIEAKDKAFIKNASLLIMLLKRMGLMKNLFILGGNGSYLNRGCEAIIRGTVVILRHHFEDPVFANITNFKDKNGLQWQRSVERDPSIYNEEIWGCKKRFDWPWFVTNILKRTYPKSLERLFYRSMVPYLPEAKAVLAVGGDNYSLDYGRRPIQCTAMDDFVVSKRKPLIIWGASIGPFTKDPSYEKYMMKHLRIAHIFARESLTIEYLRNLGLENNVHSMADPAFLLEPLEPCKCKLDFPIEKGSIGINISPLLARFNMQGNRIRWVNAAAKVVDSIIANTGRNIYLIPHVTGAPRNCDYAFLYEVVGQIKEKRAGVFLLPDTLNAAETKWVIAQMHLFAGARTHSTIAALSSFVPTLSFGYSMKSKGINKDIYGHTEYCINAENISADITAEKISEMLSNSQSIAQHLAGVIPKMKDRALEAGGLLKSIILSVE